MTVNDLAIGSLLVRLETPDAFYAESLAYIFSTPLCSPRPDIEPDLHMRILEGGSDADPSPQRNVPHDGLVIEPSHKGWAIFTEGMSAVLTGDGPERSEVRVTVYTKDAPREHLRIYLFVISTKILFLLNRVRLHSCALQGHNGAMLFLGEKGAGKSTISVTLARSGYRLLADDDVLLTQRDGTFLASGCDETIRLLPDAEAALFNHPLSITPVYSGGGYKKEILAADYFSCQPYTDVTVCCLFFSRVHTTQRVTRLTPSQVVLRLMGPLAAQHRFADKADQGRFLDYLTALARAVPAYSLELSPDLSTLKDLPGLIGECAGPPHAVQHGAGSS